MQPLSGMELLQIWERGRRRHPVDRALLLLGSVLPSSSHDELADMSIGQRDAELFRLRCAVFGTRLRGYADCPHCHERLEFDFDGKVMEDGTVPAADSRAIVAGVNFRLPTSRDLAAIAHESDVERARQQLADRCCIEDASQAKPEWTEHLLDELETQLTEIDWRADVALPLHCDACGHDWRAAFDIGEFLWEEIQSRATRLLREVDVLARAYGWREPDVLALSEERRAAYIGMVAA